LVIILVVDFSLFTTRSLPSFWIAANS